MKNPFKRGPKATIQKKTEAGTVELTFAFSIGERHYYTAPIEVMNINRYKEFMVKLQQFGMGVSREYLDEMNERVLKELDGENGQIRLKEIRSFHEELKVRLALAPIEEHVYAYLSVVFFEESENLDSYDFIENAAKINYWRTQPPAPSFFLTKPIAALIGYEGQSIGDLKDSLQRQQIVLISTLLKLGKELPDYYNQLKTSLSVSPPDATQKEPTSKGKQSGSEV